MNKETLLSILIWRPFREKTPRNPTRGFLLAHSWDHSRASHHTVILR